jgi:IstB-like ATP binding protein
MISPRPLRDAYLRVSYPLTKTGNDEGLYGKRQYTIKLPRNGDYEIYIEAIRDNQLGRALQRWTRYDLIAIDEMGYVPFAQVGAELMFQVISERAERATLVITTNLPFSEWTQVFPSHCPERAPDLGYFCREFWSGVPAGTRKIPFGLSRRLRSGSSAG